MAFRRFILDSLARVNWASLYALILYSVCKKRIIIHAKKYVLFFYMYVAGILLPPDGFGFCLVPNKLPFHRPHMVNTRLISVIINRQNVRIVEKILKAGDPSIFPSCMAALVYVP